jgi:hypothetical protein
MSTGHVPASLSVGEHRLTEQCTYQAGKLASCVDMLGKTVTLVREESGRISELEFEEDQN